MKPLVILVVLHAGLLFWTESSARNPAAPVTAGPPIFNAQHLKTGIFTYRDSDHGKEVGTSTVTIRKLISSQNYAFSNDVTFAESFAGFRSQRWEAVATPRFEPVSATLSFGAEADATPVFDLKYSSGRVIGFTIPRKGPSQGIRLTVDSSVPADTVDQRIDWAAVLASDHEPGRQFEFHVYDPNIGVSRVTAHFGPLEQVRVPAGTFAGHRITYRIEKATGTEEYQVLASRDIPHVMLREEFPNGVVSELVKAAELTTLP